jgi:hypothetical protein
MDMITDFEDNIDRIGLAGRYSGVTTVSDALLQANVENGNTVFRFDTGDVLVIEGIADKNLLQNDLVLFDM